MTSILTGVVIGLQLAAERRANNATDQPAVEQLKRVIEVLHVEWVNSETRTDELSPETMMEATGRRWLPLQRVFGLSDPEALLLQTALAPELDPNVGTAIALLQGGGQRPTMAIALELAGIGFLSADRNLLAPGSALRRWGLVSVEGDEASLGRTLRVPDRLVEYLTGDESLAPATAGMSVTIIPLATPDALTLHRFLQRGHQFCYVQESAQSAAAAAAAGAFTQTGIAWMAVDLRRLGGHLVPETIRGALMDAALLQRGLVLGGFDVLTEHDPALIRMVTNAPVPVIACGWGPWNPMWCNDLPPIIRAGRLDESMTALVWNLALGDAAETLISSGWTPVALRPEEIIRAARSALDLATSDGVPPAGEHIAEGIRNTAPVNSTPGVTRTTPRATRADLVLPERTASAIDELIGWVTHRSAVLGGGNVAGKATKGNGITALLTGGPGTGKTLAAEAIAHAVDLELMTVELPTIIDKYIGETEKNLERVFVTAEESAALLFFDEADALFGSRSSVGDSRDRYANQEVAYLLQRMEMFSGVAILATNLRGNLDPAFTRRLHFVIPFLDPDIPVRHALWTGHLASLPALDDRDPVDLDLLAAKAEVSGGSIRNIVLAAAFAAAMDGGPVGMRHLVRATVREFEKTGRRPPADLL